MMCGMETKGYETLYGKEEWEKLVVDEWCKRYIRV